MNTIRVDVVSAEELIYSGEATFVALPGEVGELGIYPRHTPFISRIKAGTVRIQNQTAKKSLCLSLAVFWKSNPTPSPSCPTPLCVAKTWTKSAPTPLKKRRKNICKTPKPKSIWLLLRPSSPSWPHNLPRCANTAVNADPCQNPICAQPLLAVPPMRLRPPFMRLYKLGT